MLACEEIRGSGVFGSKGVMGQMVTVAQRTQIPHGEANNQIEFK